MNDPWFVFAFLGDLPSIIHITRDSIAELTVKSGNEFLAPITVGSVDLMFPCKHLVENGYSSAMLACE